MRKFAGKCVALLMALLMLLTSMPLTALADSVVSSVPFTIDALEDTGENASNTPALDAVNAAIAENSTSGEYVSRRPRRRRL